MTPGIQAPAGFAHGGDVAQVARQFRRRAEDILDFSANLNPRGLPPRALRRLARDAADSAQLAPYPDPSSGELRRMLANRLQVPDDCIVIGAGSGALLHAALLALAPHRCVVPVPAFAEYERACLALRIPFVPIPLPPAQGYRLSARRLSALREGDLLILNNPHNPTGACLSRDAMRTLATITRARRATVLADEAFVDYAPRSALTRLAATSDGIVSLRSLTKLFGCAGLRAGYAVAAPATARRMAACVPAWPVTTLALHAFTEALRDRGYLRATLADNARARRTLANGLRQLGCRVSPSGANFIFFELPIAASARRVRAHLVRRAGILVRECDSFTNVPHDRCLRVAVRNLGDNQRFTAALAAILERKSC